MARAWLKDSWHQQDRRQRDGPREKVPLHECWPSLHDACSLVRDLWASTGYRKLVFFFFLIPVLARRIKVLGPASNTLSHPEQILGLSFFICKENDADSKNGGDNNEDDDPCLLISIPVW